MFMAQKTEICSAGCIDGEITHYFAHHSEKRLREGYTQCRICRPGGNPTTAVPEVGEEQIGIEEYYKLFDLGWREFDPV